MNSRGKRAGSALEQLEARILELIDAGVEVRMEDLRFEFPSIDEADIERVRSSAVLLHGLIRSLDDGVGDVLDGPGSRPRDWLRAGDQIGGYLVQCRIPGGGMGQVYRATQLALHPRQVALKVYRSGANPERALARARNEAEIASRVVHPHLAAIHDMGHDARRGLAYFSMQFVEGPDLRVELGPKVPRSAAFRVRRLVTRLSEVAGALAELHARGYVHRDVKPENILLHPSAGRDGKSEAAVLVDFGLARAEQALVVGEGAERPAGTPGYMPPEAEQGDAAVRPTWDVYSLGVVLFEVLRGEPLARDAHGMPRPPSRTELAKLRACVPVVDRNLHAVILKATDATPSARYRDARALQRDLEAWLAGTFVSARAPHLVERVVLTTRNLRARHLAAFLVLACVPFFLGSIALAVWEVRVGMHALRAGDLVGGWERLGGAGALGLRLLPAEARILRPDLSDGTSQLALARIVRAASAGENGRSSGVPSSFDLAAAYLQAKEFPDGSVDRSLVRAHLLYGLRSADDSKRLAALRATARLFFETPVLDAQTFEEFRGLRDRVVEILVGKPSGIEGLYCAQVVGGCGSPSDLGPLLDWIEGSRKSPDKEAVPVYVLEEILRLGLRSTERITRRTRGIEAQRVLSGPEWEQIGERVGALVPQALEELTPGSYQHWALLQAYASWIEAWGLLHRAATGVGSRSLLATWPGGPWYVDWSVRAAIGDSDPSFRATLERGPDLTGIGGGTAAEDTIEPWGRICAYLEDQPLRERIRKRLEADPARLQAFDFGWDLGLACLRQGPDPVQAPDPASHLVHLLGEPTPGGEQLALPFEPESLAEEPFARWNFKSLRRGPRSSPVLRIGGGASHLEHQIGSHHAHLRLPGPGAWVEVSFENERATGDRYPALVLHHLAAQRTYVPFEGQAWIRVDLDGTPLVERLLVQDAGLAIDRLHLDRRTSTTPGPHHLRITLLEATTTYWLEELRIE